MNELQTLMLEHYERIIQMIRCQFGESCQSVLYSIQKNGKKYEGEVITSSGCLFPVQPEDPMPSYVLNQINECGAADKLRFINNHHPGMQLRSSVLFIRDGSGQVFACLCVHFDLEHISKIMGRLEESLELLKNMTQDKNTMFALMTFKAKDVNEFVQSVIAEFMSALNMKEDVTRLDVDAKLKLIAELYEKGIFEVEGSVNTISQQLDLSKFKIFSFLDELRANKIKNRVV